jgi:hypothetical protein
MEHRCGSRHEVDIAVYARSHGGVVSSVGFLRDISASGGFLLTHLPLPLLAKLTLRLIDADGNFGSTLEGHVVRRVSHGIGIEWSDYVPEVIRALQGSMSESSDSRSRRSASGGEE